MGGVNWGRCYPDSFVEFWLVPAFLLSSAVTAIYGSFRIFTVLFTAKILWGICFSFIRQAGTITVVSVTNGSHPGFLQYLLQRTGDWYLHQELGFPFFT
jgi:hypothetical protein